MHALAQTVCLLSLPEEEQHGEVGRQSGAKQ